MKRVVVALVLTIVLVPGSARAEQWSWNYLIEKLVADGVQRQRVVAVFEDARVEPFGGLEFSLDPPREHRSMYGGFLRPARIAAARRCRAANADAFEAAAEKYGVSADVIASILFIESGCGRNSGSSRVFYRLARLAMANEPENLRHNFERFSDDSGRLDPETEERLRARARYLERTFYPRCGPCSRSPIAWASTRSTSAAPAPAPSAYPQFLPTSYLAFGVDANGDGRVSLYDPVDAAASCARYLAATGGALAHGQRRAPRSGVQPLGRLHRHRPQPGDAPRPETRPAQAGRQAQGEGAQTPLSRAPAELAAAAPFQPTL